MFKLRDHNGLLRRIKLGTGAGLVGFGFAFVTMPFAYAGINDSVAPSQATVATIKQQRSQAQFMPQPNVIYYDAIEQGQIIGGGVIEVDQTNPMQAPYAAPLAPAPYNSTTILNNGAPENRVDIVLVGDGYTSGEISSYINHANNLVNGFFNEGVLNTYKSYFNVHRVDVISNQSGVDNDPQGTDRDTALDMTYFCSNIARLLCVNVSKARQAADNAPESDQILALANSTTYGGAGYPSSNLGTVAGNNGSALEVAIHEFGHSFADLADEYTYGGDETYTGPELNAVNVSIYQKADMQQLQTKWFRWFDVAGVDTFEGGNYSVYGVYRPTNNSKMRSLGQPFGAINDEQFVIKIYQTVSPIDSATPAGNVSKGTVINVNPVQPLNHDLTIEWWVDGQLSNQTGESFNTGGLSAGNHTVAVRVTDNTDYVRNESARQQWMTEERIWTVLDSNTPFADLNVSLKANTLFGWAEPFQHWQKGETGTVKFTATISNQGPEQAQQINLQIPVPSEAAFSEFASDKASCYLVVATLNCDINSLENAESAEIALTFTTIASQSLNFTATVNSDVADPDSGNNSTTNKFGGSVGLWLLIMLAGLAVGRRRKIKIPKN